MKGLAVSGLVHNSMTNNHIGENLLN